MKKVLMPLAAAITAATLLTACGQSNVKESMDTAATEVASMNNNDLYEVHEDGRIYVFDDRATYESFLEVGETSYRKVRIGAGPKGETVVFGLTDADKKKKSTKKKKKKGALLSPVLVETFVITFQQCQVQVFTQRACKQPHLLAEVADAPPQITRHHLPHIDPVDQDASTCWLMQPGKHFKQCRLA